MSELLNRQARAEPFFFPSLFLKGMNFQWGKKEEKDEAPKKMHQPGDDDCYIKKINLECIKISQLWGEKRGKEEKKKHRYH